MSGRAQHSWSAPTSVHASPDVSPSRATAHVQTQIEFYFSQQNLATDAYLRSQMDDSQYVDLAVIADFKKVKRFTDDMDDIIASIRRSKLLELDATGTKVRAAMKPAERTTIILRDIPSDTPRDDILSLFDNDACGKVLSLHDDIGDTWFVTFEDEDACLRSAQYIRQQTFNGKPVSMRVKSENMMRSYHQETVPMMAVPASAVFPPHGLMFPGGGVGRPMPPVDMRWNLRRSQSFIAAPLYDHEGRPIYPAAMPAQGQPRRTSGDHRPGAPSGDAPPRRRVGGARKPPREFAGAHQQPASAPGSSNSSQTPNGVTSSSTGGQQQRPRKPRHARSSTHHPFYPGRRSDDASSAAASATLADSSDAAPAVKPDLGLENFPALPTAASPDVSSAPDASEPQKPFSYASIARRTVPAAPVTVGTATLDKPGAQQAE
ncbi:hypothetical protein PBRA_007240 [Plasmodiophora brassicae]|uniref:HTH La-type RNA-binding domain-containing protein n=1 Tax=Plasmodiophora brassicae TaxID=37360 RepID=A0A0G4IW85_PLABS|nr:hypothetical protein PBRA_007240 [Plasmodiophora brassicae]